MKKLLCVLIALCSFAASAFAQADDRAIFHIRLSDNSNLALSMDERVFKKQGPSLTLHDLPSGKHRIIVYRVDGGRQRELIFKGKVRIDAGNEYTCIVDVDRGSLRMRIHPMDGGADYSRNDGNNPAPMARNHNNDNGRDDMPQNNEMPPPADNDNNQQAPQDNGNEAVEKGMSDADMSDLQAKVAKKLTDSEKEKELKKDLAEQPCTTEQVRTMLHWFNFESTKLDFAKWVPKNVVDGHNYPSIENEFSMEKNRKEFHDFVGQE